MDFIMRKLRESEKLALAMVCLFLIGVLVIYNYFLLKIDPIEWYGLDINVMILSSVIVWIIIILCTLIIYFVCNAVIENMMLKQQLEKEKKKN